MSKKEDNKNKTQTVLPLTAMSIAELTAKSRQLFADISKKRLDKIVGRLKNTREIFNLGKEHARVKTLISVKSRD